MREDIEMIAITGAAGFIGSNLAHRLAAMGRHLLLVDHPFSAAKSANWVGLSRSCSVADALFLGALRSRDLPIESIFHLGACSSTTETDWNYLLWNNVKFSQAIWIQERRRRAGGARREDQCPPAPALSALLHFRLAQLDGLGRDQARAGREGRVVRDLDDVLRPGPGRRAAAPG